MARKSYRNKSKFQFTKPLIALIVFFVIIVVVGIITIQPTKKEKLYKLFLNESGEPILAADHILNKVSKKELKKAISKTGDEYMFVLYASPNDPTTISSLAEIMTYAEACNVTKLYYLDSSNYSTVLNADEEEVYDINDSTAGDLKKYLDVDGLDTKAFLSQTALLVFKNGKCEFSFSFSYDEDNVMITGNSVMDLIKRGLALNLPVGTPK